MADLKVGGVREFRGNVTTLFSLRPGEERTTEKTLGLSEGHLSRGYYILLLRQFLALDDFILAGYTYFTGTRLEGTSSADQGLLHSTRVQTSSALREHMYDHVVQHHGLDNLEAFKRLARKGMAVTGRHRIAKLLPTSDLDARIAAEDRYAPGHGVPQFELRRPRRFLVAVKVTEEGKAITPTFEVDLRSGGPGARKRLREFMEAA